MKGADRTFKTTIGIRLNMKYTYQLMDEGLIEIDDESKADKAYPIIRSNFKLSAKKDKNGDWQLK